MSLKNLGTCLGLSAAIFAAGCSDGLVVKGSRDAGSPAETGGTDGGTAGTSGSGGTSADWPGGVGGDSDAGTMAPTDASADVLWTVDAGETCATLSYYYYTGTSPVCIRDAIAPVTVENGWACPAGTIPKSQCWNFRCDSSLPSGPCDAGSVYSCVGWNYSFVQVSCSCLEATWSCAL
jgi:hypothetical protein